MFARTLAWFRTFPLALKALTLWALVAGLASIGMSVGPALDGEVYGYTRIALGIIGTAGVLTILSGRARYTIGLNLLFGWSLLQLPFISSAVDGNLTRQLVDGLLGVSQSQAINGVVTDFSATGLNLVGIVLTGIALSVRRDSGFLHRTAQGTPVNA